MLGFKLDIYYVQSEQDHHWLRQFITDIFVSKCYACKSWAREIGVAWILTDHMILPPIY